MSYYIVPLYYIMQSGGEYSENFFPLRQAGDVDKFPRALV